MALITHHYDSKTCPSTTTSMAPAGLNKKKRQKLSISPLYLVLGVLTLAIFFVGYNLSFLRKSLHQQQTAESNGGAANSNSKATRGDLPVKQKTERRDVVEEKVKADKKQPKNADADADETEEEEEESYEPITDGVQYQLIFSTGCNAFQDWQSYMFFFHAAKVLKAAKPPYSCTENTHVTRIASGCTNEDADLMRKVHKEQFDIMTPRKNFHLHLTPDFSYVHGGTKEYKYFNKV